MSPTYYYYEPTRLFVDGSFRVVDVGVLVGAFVMLGKASTKIMQTRLAEVLVAGLVGGGLGGALHYCTNAALGNVVDLP